MQWSVIFDFDGVIVDSEIHWRAVEHEFLSKLVPGWSENDQEKILGMSVYDVHALLTRDYGLKLPQSEYVNYYRELSQTIYGHCANLLPGVKDLISSLFESGVPLAIATSSPKDWLKIALKRFSLEPYIAACASSDDVHGIGKPAPDVYLFAAKLLHLPPRKCVAIEDTRKGIMSAKSAGMVCVGLHNGFNESQDLSQADRIVSGLQGVTLDDLRCLISSS